MPDAHLSHLPRPFYDQWSRGRRPAAHALWAWHSALADPQPPGTNGTEGAVEAFFDEERRRAEEGDPLRLLREEVWSSAYAVCDEHGLDRSLLAAQVKAARAAALAGNLDLKVQLRYADELARGFFHLGRLLALPRDVKKGRLFIPREALEQKGVTADQLRDGAVNEAVQGLLWKESVRIRDALAQGRPLVPNLSMRHRFALKRFWVGALALLNELERRDYDLWSEPLDLSLFRRVQVYLQTLLGRSVSR